MMSNPLLGLTTLTTLIGSVAAFGGTGALAVPVIMAASLLGSVAAIAAIGAPGLLVYLLWKHRNDGK